MSNTERLIERLQEIGGCSDGGCIVIRPRGMHTNGGCRCSRDSFTMQRVIRAYQSALGMTEPPRKKVD